MDRIKSWTRVAWGVLGLVVVGAFGAPVQASEPDPYIRVVESEDGSTLKLEISVRTLERRDGKGPTVHMAGAVHIADASYYETLQQMLDAHDVVLFEGVKPGGFEDTDDMIPSERVRVSERRVRFAAIGVEQYKREFGRYPTSLDDLSELSDEQTRMLIEGAAIDAWGNALVYTVSDLPERYEVLSLGADGEDGGDGFDRDLKFTDQKKLSDAERGEGEGLQTQLADAFGLVFQLDAMDHSKPNWRNSDMTIDEVVEKLSGGKPGVPSDGDKGGGGTPADELFGLLDGSSFSAKAAGFLLKLIGSSKTMSTLGKVMLIELLSNADAILAAQPGPLGDMMDVLIIERNKVVVDDLRSILENEQDVEDVGIIYGAGHLKDLEYRLGEHLGYEFVSDEWITAIEVDVEDTGMSPDQVRQMRSMMTKALQAQLKMMK